LTSAEVRRKDCTDPSALPGRPWTPRRGSRHQKLRRLQLSLQVATVGGSLSEDTGQGKQASPGRFGMDGPCLGSVGHDHYIRILLHSSKISKIKTNALSPWDAKAYSCDVHPVVVETLAAGGGPIAVSVERDLRRVQQQSQPHKMFRDQAGFRNRPASKSRPSGYFPVIM
jgi:hypothetical protein